MAFRYARLRSGAFAGLEFLRPALAAADFTEEGLAGLLDPSCLSVDEIPALIWKCQHEPSARARMALLWLLREPLPPADLQRLLGTDGLAILQRRGLITDNSALVDLYPCGDAWIFTDPKLLALQRQQSSRPRSRDHVYWLGGDSYTLARATPRGRVSRALDLCTGSGVQAILGAMHADESVGVDINPRALSFSRFNAAVNGVGEKCRFVKGDLYDAVAGPRFDLIVSNPPWIAIPDTTTPYYRSGGITGEEITERIVRGLPGALAEGGTLAMFVYYPVMAQVTYVERLRSWLGGADGWGIAVADLYESGTLEFVQKQRQPYAKWSQHVEHTARWLDSLAEHGIEAMRAAMVYVRRLSPGAPGWAEVRQIPVPRRSIAASLEKWLALLERCHHPRWLAGLDEWKPRLSSGVSELWMDLPTGRGKIRFHDHGLYLEDSIEPAGMRFLLALDGQRTASDMADAWAAESGVEVTQARSAVAANLRLLASRGIIE
jgi:carbamoyltransferase